MPSEQSLLYQEEKGIARIIFNRPKALNALSRDLLQELSAQLENVRGNEAVKAVILTGA